VKKWKEKFLEWYWRLRLSYSGKTPIFVFQMGKVGSSTVYYSLKNQLPNRFILHAHDFKPDHKRIVKVRALYKHFKKHPERPLKIITLVRDPIGRNISGFFQEYERYVGRPFRHDDFSVEELRNIFLEKYNHRAPLDWMDRLKSHFDIDVYAEPILPSHYKRYQSGSVECLLLRHDIDNEEKARILQDFLGLDHLEIENYNQSIRHVYGAKYREFKQALTLPKDFLQKMRSSRYYTHFYTAEEIQGQCAKWEE